MAVDEMKTGSKHTPGPWTYFHDTCAKCEEDGTKEFVIDGPPGGNHGQFSNEADASLMAASPELLGAAKAVLADHCRCMFTVKKESIDLLVEAIAKAEQGERP